MKSIRRCLSTLLVVLFLATTPAFALGLGSNPLSDIKYQDGKLAWQLSQAYQMAVSADQVSFLLWKLDYGEVALLFALSDASGKSPEEIYNLRVTDGLGWGKIAEKFDVKLTNVMPKISDILKNAKLENEDKALKAKIEQEKSAGGKAVIAPEKQKAAPAPKAAFKGHSISPRNPGGDVTED